MTQAYLEKENYMSFPNRSPTYDLPIIIKLLLWMLHWAWSVVEHQILKNSCRSGFCLPIYKEACM